MAKSNLSMIGRAAKMATLGATRRTRDMAEAVQGAARDILLTAVDGVAQAGIAAEKGAVQIVTGAVRGAAEDGGKVMLVLKWTIHSMVTGASEVGADVGRTAVAAVSAGIEAAEKVGADARRALKHAVAGAVEAADEIGGTAAKVVRAVLRNSIKGARDVIKELSRKQARSASPMGRRATEPRGPNRPPVAHGARDGERGVEQCGARALKGKCHGGDPGRR